MMGGRAANFVAAQYAGRCSNFTLDDKLLNVMDKIDYAGPLFLHPFHLKEKTLCYIGHLKVNSVPAIAETWDLKCRILRSGRMWSWIILMLHL